MNTSSKEAAMKNQRNIDKVNAMNDYVRMMESISEEIYTEKTGELVATFPRDAVIMALSSDSIEQVLPEVYLHRHGHLVADLSRHLMYEHRMTAETNPLTAHPIVYDVLMNEEQDAVFLYRRTKKVGEQRLSGKVSLGIGGHIGPGKQPMDLVSKSRYHHLHDMIERSRIDEHTSELVGGEHLAHTRPKKELVIYQPTDEVGKQHLGLVRVYAIDISFECKEEELETIGHVRLDEIKEMYYDQMEPWSQLIFDALIKKGEGS